jgi:hypothetical protein
VINWLKGYHGSTAITVTQVVLKEKMCRSLNREQQKSKKCASNVLLCCFAAFHCLDVHLNAWE